MHVLRLDDPKDLQNAFDSASGGKLESKRKSTYFKSQPPPVTGSSTSMASQVYTIGPATGPAASSKIDVNYGGSDTVSTNGSDHSQTNLLSGNVAASHTNFQQIQKQSSTSSAQLNGIGIMGSRARSK